MDRNGLRITALSLITAGSIYLSSLLNEGNAQTNNYSDLNNPIQIAQTLTNLPSIEDRIIGNHEGTIIFYGPIDIALNGNNSTYKITGNDPTAETALSVLERIVNTISQFPPYMIKEKCNVDIVYLTTDLNRADEDVVGLAIPTRGTIILDLREQNLYGNFFESIVLHENYHMCELNTIDDIKTHDDEWIDYFIQYGGTAQYYGDEWNKWDPNILYIGYPSVYSLKDPVEHRATMWVDTMTRYTDAHLHRFRDDRTYKMLFYRTMQLMREWSNGMIDHEVYGLIAKGIDVNQQYYINTFGDYAFQFKPK
jgi:hypothetical protein